MLETEELSPTEAAVVAGVTVREVNSAVDDRILPFEFAITGGRRAVRREACPLIAFYYGAEHILTADARKEAIAEVATRLLGRPEASPSTEGLILKRDFVTFDVSDFVKRADDGLDRLSKAREMVTTDPDVLNGTPVVKGTRIPVYDVASSLSAGIDIDRVAAAYPRLSREQIELCATFAQAYPKRGRPTSAARSPDLVVSSERRIRRRSR